MARRTDRTLCFCAGAVLSFSLAGSQLRAQDSSETREQLRQLQKQNEALQEQLRQQQSLIEALTKKVNDIQDTSAQRSRELEQLESQVKEGPPMPKPAHGFGLGKVSISGEGAAGFFKGGSESIFPNGSFRVDEAKLFVEAPIWGEVYFFGELNLMTRESADLSLQLGELYLDFENISKLWNRDGMLNLRVGRLDIPFGEEYLTRDAIDNPLISHSLTDFWGVDEGVELYGSAGKFSYVIAAQNGGPSGVSDANSDKSVAGRLSFDPARWLHLSASGMRTGALDLPEDYWSELYFASAWFMPFGSTNVTRFHAELVEGDVEVRLPHGHIKASGGYIHYDDNATDVHNRRDMYFYAIEGVHDITRKLYGAARFSQILVNNGYPISGNGGMDQYFFSGAQTDNIWRLSLGMGYRFSQNLAIKTEYTFERGRTVAGDSRDHSDLFAIEAAFRF